LFGMNVDLPMQESPIAFISLAVAMFLIIFALLFYFKRRRWI
jgi:Mg2+ and Co2+ transporter CorA